ncbi:phage tail protein [Citrobacter sp. Cpo142]|uniref:phage tail protein n=1 Tax=Citrobacter sp. Cpo142 TaxID=2985151 RepID=UPI002575561A|nr:phage tail protein [Citrobacter sp. Cpo142]MDM2775693.1 phage tail protein [Citrobacter sp. Cpo142]
MTTKYLALLTNIGAAKLAKATALGTKVEITQMAVGDGNGVLPTPEPAQTTLIHEIRRAPLNMLTVDPANASQIIAEQVIPEDVGGWWIREIGLFDKDGDMIAVANCAETYKPQLQEGSGRVQAIRVILIVSSTEAVTLKIDPAVVLATRQYVDNKIIEVKSYADGLMRTHEQSRNHPDATTTAKGFTQLNSSVTDDSETQAATPKAVKIAMDNANARLAKERNLADLPNPALARQNLQLGNSSTKNTGTTADTVAAGDDARITGAMQKSQNGADIPDVAKFLQNLGMGDVIHGDWCSVAGFLVGDITKPYIRHSGQKKDAPLQLHDAVLDDLSGKSKSELRAYLELKSAAQRDIGIGINQIPDMNSFPTELNHSGYQKLPGGLIIQWGRETIPAGGIFVNFPIPFPNIVFSIALGSAGDNSIIITANGYQNNGFSFSANKPTLVPQTYIAVGY